MHVGIKGWPVWSEPIGELQHAAYGAPEQSGFPCQTPSTTESSNNGNELELDHAFVYITWMAGCVSVHHIPGINLAPGCIMLKKASWRR